MGELSVGSLHRLLQLCLFSSLLLSLLDSCTLEAGCVVVSNTLLLLLLFTRLFTLSSLSGRVNFLYRSLPAKEVSESMEELNNTPADTQDDEPILSIN